MRMIYFDNAATTRVDEAVLAEMLPYFTEQYGNPSLSYGLARKARQALHLAEQRVQDALCANNYQIIFTASGSESNNIAIRLLLEQNKHKGKHIICSAIEHPSVLRTCQYWESQGYELSILPADAEGIVESSALQGLLRPDTALVCLMQVNNEIGSIQHIQELSALCHAHQVLFHCDGIQAVPYLQVSLDELNVDAYSISAHKFHGPKGVGALLLKRSIRRMPLIHGGEQEKGVRAGTENVAGIVGLGKAIVLAAKERQANYAHALCLQKALYSLLQDRLADKIEWNGSMDLRVPGNLNFRIKGRSSTLLMAQLDMRDICVSAGSACAAGSIYPSPTLLAIREDPAAAKESLRISFSKYNTMEEVEYFVKVLQDLVR